MTAGEQIEGLTRFDPLADSYESWFESRIGALVDRREKKLLARMVAPRPGQTILEVGSGTGYFLREFARSGARCVGVEPSEQMLAIAVAANGRGTEYVRICGEGLPFPGHCFDLVAYITTLEFVADVEQSLLEAARVCKPGGRLVFVVLNARGPWFRQRQAEGGLWHETRFFLAAELRSLLQPFGAVDVDYCVHLPPSLGWLPAWTMPMADTFLRWIGKIEAPLLASAWTCGGTDDLLRLPILKHGRTPTTRGGSPRTSAGTPPWCRRSGTTRRRGPACRCG